jgi:quercetin dioxygenase-like cupin family protein
MSTEPTYLPLLRRIANAECNAEQYLSAWAGAITRDDVRRVITTVALREGEHAMAFQKRICELGFDVTIEEAPATAGKVAVGAASDLTDREKFEKLGLGSPPDTSTPDRWADYFGDCTIDIATGELLGRFISEERDSVRLLADCYATLCAEDGTTTTADSTDARIDRIERMLNELVAKIDAAPSTVTEAEFRAGLRRDGFDDEIRISKYEPCVEGGSLHAHEFSARLFVLEGAFTVRYEDGPQTYSAGQCCQLDAGTMHTECTGEAGARVLAGLKHHS